MGRRVVLAMSGGVDSSVSAWLLREQGYDVVGLFMRTGSVAEHPHLPLAPTSKIRGCCSAIDACDAQRVADRLDIPFYALNFAEEFKRIKDYFADEYQRGRTPNPCVVCNTWLKFGKLWEYGQAVGADFIATGHYARIILGADGVELHQAVDPTKDQSYFLHGLAPDLLSRVIFPIGSMPKSAVRALAEQHDLGVHDKPDSQEVCFVPTGNYQDFLSQHRPDWQEPAGTVVDLHGQTVGAHAGISRYTIGQRKGLGIAFGEPRYVVELDTQHNVVVVGPQEALLRSEFEVDEVNWLTQSTGTIPCDVRIRYKNRGAAAVVERLEGNRARVRFQEPQSAITPGQAAVFYAGTRVLGGGWIADAPTRLRTGVDSELASV